MHFILYIFFTQTVQDNLQKNDREVALELTAKHRLRILFENLEYNMTKLVDCWFSI